VQKVDKSEITTKRKIHAREASQAADILDHLGFGKKEKLKKSGGRVGIELANCIFYRKLRSC
jgi:adenylate cyclase class IV